MRKTLFLFLPTLLFATFSFAQPKNSFQKVQLENTTEAFIHSETGQLRFVKMTPNSGFTIAKSDQWFEKFLKPKADEDWSLLRAENDKIGMKHHRYQHTYKGIAIENEVFILHEKQGLIESANGLFKEIHQNYSNKIILDEKTAFNKALTLIPGKSISLMKSEMEAPVLRWVSVNDDLRLCYKIDVYAFEPLFREYVYVDVQNGEILDRLERIHEGDVPATAETRYSGTQTITVDSVNPTLYRLRETSRGDGVTTLNLNNGTNYTTAVDFTDDDNFWNTTTNQDDAALDAHFGAAATYDYFFNVHGRDSYDNLGSELISYVHYGNNYVNAFWNGVYMTYGDGSAGSGYGPLTSIEIAGHEMVHGVTEFTAGLIYNAESGALNESFSDIFGVVIDLVNNPSTANYKIGDQIHSSGNGFRNMANPNDNNDPDTYFGTYWHTAPSDNYGVHVNSGVQNFWFYLLVNGGTGTNDVGNAYSVTGLGLSMAADVTYRNLAVYLTQSSDYQEANFYSIQAAKDLYGPCAPEVQSVIDAWYAVGINSQSGIDPSANFSASRTTFCALPASVDFINASTGATTFTWDFGDGNTSTDTNPMHTYSSVGSYTVRLIADASPCPNLDTLVMTNLINVTNTGAVNATCEPITTQGSNNEGVTFFSLNTISNNSNPSSAGYESFTCDIVTTVTEGQSYPMMMNTGVLSRALIWIDLNNDGDFEDVNELMYDGTSNGSGVHSSDVIIPNGVLFNQEIRLRILVDRVSENKDLPCAQPRFGQVEDYSIVIQENNLAPIANFGAVKTRVTVNESVQLMDSSLNAPTNFSWKFTDANISTSNLRHPVISFSAIGVYPIKLTVSNSDGTDSITKLTYIIVQEEENMCNGVSYSSAAYGTLFDSGGPNGNYGNFEDCGFVIDIPCAKGVKLSKNSFVNFSSNHTLYIYHGTDLSGGPGSLIAAYSGNKDLSDITYDYMPLYIHFVSNSSTTSSGFGIQWNAIDQEEVPNTPILSNIGFNIQAGREFSMFSVDQGYPLTQNWDFGDGSVGSGNFVKHTYDEPGIYNVTLYSENCVGDSLFTQEVIVNRDVNANAASMDVFPSPSEGNFTIKENYKASVAEIQITNVMGQQIVRRVPDYLATTHQFDMSGVAAGVYYIKVLYSDQTTLFGEVVLH
jgi:Zn-dependent metalloprotease